MDEGKEGREEGGRERKKKKSVENSKRNNLRDRKHQVAEQTLWYEWHKNIPSCGHDRKNMMGKSMS